MTDRSAVRRGGLDLGGTKIQAVIVDETYAVQGSARQPTPTSGGPRDVAAAMAATLRQAASLAGVEPSALAAVGVGSPGAVDAETGTVSGAGNLPGWSGAYPLGPELADLLEVPVVLGNDVQVATAAEFALGVGRPYRSLIGVFCGTGVGGGIYLDGRPWLGRGAAGEIGHMVIRQDGARCPCGRYGCLEAYAGRGAMELEARRLVQQGERTDLFDIMAKKGRTRLSSGVFARALARNDPMAGYLVNRAVQALGAGIASVVNLLDLEAVIIGGGLGLRLGDPFVEAVREATLPHLFVPSRPPAMHLAALGDLGGAIGATLTAAS
ncbi:MAG TPA: ROK family protein [Pseudonocardiaceae bacterium]|nr:ROK family protein [Pseudonocardiaceae bacterium]